MYRGLWWAFTLVKLPHINSCLLSTACGDVIAFLFSWNKLYGAVYSILSGATFLNNLLLQFLSGRWRPLKVKAVTLLTSRRWSLQLHICCICLRVYLRFLLTEFATGRTVRGSNPGGDEISRTVQADPGACPASYIMGTGSLSRG